MYFPFVLFTTYTRWPNLLEQLHNNRRALKIIIYIDFDFKFGQYIKKKIVPRLNGHYEIIVQSSINNGTIPINTDLLITNIYMHLDFPLEKTICVSHFITDKEIETIFKRIDLLENTML